MPLCSMLLRLDMPGNPLRGLAQRAHGRVRGPGRTAFAIAAVDPDGAAAGRGPGVDVPPPVANHEAAGGIGAVPRRAFQDEAGQRFAATAPVGVVVKAAQEIVYRQVLAEAPVNRLDRL